MCPAARNSAGRERGVLPEPGAVGCPQRACSADRDDEWRLAVGRRGVEDSVVKVDQCGVGDLFAKTYRVHDHVDAMHGTCQRGVTINLDDCGRTGSRLAWQSRSVAIGAERRDCVGAVGQLGERSGTGATSGAEHKHVNHDVVGNFPVRAATRAAPVMLTAPPHSNAASMTRRIGNGKPALATIGPMLAPVNSTRPLSAMPLARCGAAASPNKPIMAGTASAIPDTKSRLAMPWAVSEPGRSSWAAGPPAASRYPAPASPVWPPGSRRSGPAARAVNMPGSATKRSENTLSASWPRVARCAPSEVYMATNVRRSVRCAAHRKRMERWVSRRVTARNCRANPPELSARRGSRRKVAIRSVLTANRAALPANIHAHPNCSATAWATTCPRIPAMRNAVDTHPIAMARHRGATDSLR